MRCLRVLLLCMLVVGISSTAFEAVGDPLPEVWSMSVPQGTKAELVPIIQQVKGFSAGCTCSALGDPYPVFDCVDDSAECVAESVCQEIEQRGLQTSQIAIWLQWFGYGHDPHQNEELFDDANPNSPMLSWHPADALDLSLPVIAARDLEVPVTDEEDVVRWHRPWATPWMTHGVAEGGAWIEAFIDRYKALQKARGIPDPGKFLFDTEALIRVTGWWPDVQAFQAMLEDPRSGSGGVGTPSEIQDSIDRCEAACDAATYFDDASAIQACKNECDGARIPGQNGQTLWEIYQDFLIDDPGFNPCDGSDCSPDHPEQPHCEVGSQNPGVYHHSNRAWFSWYTGITRTALDHALYKAAYKPIKNAWKGVKCSNYFSSDGVDAEPDPYVDSWMGARFLLNYTWDKIWNCHAWYRPSFEGAGDFLNPVLYPLRLDYYAKILYWDFPPDHPLYYARENGSYADVNMIIDRTDVEARIYSHPDAGQPWGDHRAKMMPWVPLTGETTYEPQRIHSRDHSRQFLAMLRAHGVERMYVYHNRGEFYYNPQHWDAFAELLYQVWGADAQATGCMMGYHTEPYPTPLIEQSDREEFAVDAIPNCGGAACPAGMVAEDFNVAIDTAFIADFAEDPDSLRVHVEARASRPVSDPPEEVRYSLLLWNYDNDGPWVPLEPASFDGTFTGVAAPVTAGTPAPRSVFHGDLPAGQVAADFISDTATPFVKVRLVAASDESFSLNTDLIQLVGTDNRCSDDSHCEDNNICTIDSCVAGECTYSPNDCDDGNACTDDSCSDGVCINEPNDANECSDDNPCTTNACVDGACEAYALPDGTECSDGIDCNSMETCQSGECVFASVELWDDCEDGIECTLNYCDPYGHGGCTWVDGCDEGEMCTPFECISDSIPCEDYRDCGLVHNDSCYYQDCVDGYCGEVIPRIFGDVAGSSFDSPPNGVVNLTDIQCILNAFGPGNLANCPYGDLVGAPGDNFCDPNGIVNLSDINAVLDAFSHVYACDCEENQ